MASEIRLPSRRELRRRVRDDAEHRCQCESGRCRVHRPGVPCRAWVTGVAWIVPVVLADGEPELRLYCGVCAQVSPRR